ncbi:YegP family protein [Pseudarthrobacter enclensis]|uniref:YegP family protein n=1 Tax=Pseudarthrobacter enclensis TaxID=993070 RepID=UPI003EE0DF41
MAGTFELYNADESSFAFRLRNSDGTLIAESAKYPDKESAVRAIRTARECAATGHVTDRCTPDT